MNELDPCIIDGGGGPVTSTGLSMAIVAVALLVAAVAVAILARVRGRRAAGMASMVVALGLLTFGAVAIVAPPQAAASAPCPVTPANPVTTTWAPTATTPDPGTSPATPTTDVTTTTTPPLTTTGGGGGGNNGGGNERWWRQQLIR